MKIIESLINLYLHSFSGTSGSVIKLTANFLRIISHPQWVLYQYHVDFKPPMESRRLRVGLLFQHAEILGPARSFDGAQLFLSLRLHSKVPTNAWIQQFLADKFLNNVKVYETYPVFFFVLFFKSVFLRSISNIISWRAAAKNEQLLSE